MMGNKKELKTARDKNALTIFIPKTKTSDYVHGFKVELADVIYKELMKLTEEELEKTKKFATYGIKRKKKK